MTYFVHTVTDLNNAKREIGDALIRLLNDTALKMDRDETADRRYLLEDLITRIADVATGTCGSDVSPFPAVMDSTRVTPAYALIGEQPGVNPADMSPLVKASVRETHNLQEFEGVRRHVWSGTTFGDGTCQARVNGGDLTCGLAFDNPVHDWWF